MSLRSLLKRATQRLGSKAERVEWIHADIAEVTDIGPFDVWHDRALFHFLTSANARKRSARLLDGTVAPHGFAIIATFGPEGPETCSGLPVHRYDAGALGRELGGGFELLRSQTVDHVTPHGRHQQFMYAVFARSDR